MKKQYTAPQTLVTEFETEGFICASPQDPKLHNEVGGRTLSKTTGFEDYFTNQNVEESAEKEIY